MKNSCSLACLVLLLTTGGCLSSPVTPTLTSDIATPPPDPCEGQPCLNGGSCAPLPTSPETSESSSDTQAYACTCSGGYTGRNCEFFADPCTSSPCLHGNCSRSGDGSMYTCECSEGFGGERCDQPLLSQATFTWGSSSVPPVPEHATPATTSTPTTVPSTTQAPPTLQPWQPRLGQRVAEVAWEEEQVTEGTICGNVSSGTVTLSLEVADETAVKIQMNGSWAAVLWRVSQREFQRCSILDGTAAWIQQASDGLVLPGESLPLGHSYFLGFLRSGAPGVSEVLLRLHLTVKASSCVEPGSRFSDPQCSGGGRCVTQPTKSTFYCECEEGYSGIFCEEFDACHLKPCENGATCSDLRQGDEGRNFTCTCPPGYTGERCQVLVDHCLSQPCKNGATCSSDLLGPTCHCPEGYQGAQCDQRIDPCGSSPCHNNGSCFSDGRGFGFGCGCAPGFTGPTCAQLVDFCALNPCAHGICRSVGTSYRCLCVPGYHGLYCEEEYNECLSAPCQNHATCRDRVNAYECVCTPQYQGRHCEIYKDPCLKMHCQNGGTCERLGLNSTCVCLPGYMGADCEIDINECDSNPCHHGGTCIDQSNGFTCHCPQGWVGANCEIHLQWKAAHPEDTLPSMPRHSLYIIIGALCVAFVLMLIILIVGICRISRIEYQGSSRHAYQEFYNCRSIDSEFSNAIASIRHARFGKKSRPAMYDATPITYEDYSPDDKPLVTLIKTKDL
ncbi:hypothetical protein SKAU_G00081680 [Synaphobranchus kaupii]|uniref:EGF-like domain-containing protein n=1 Tax=Synaphobranchus kaupii TaxID=118154 RepID=A0A9Q1FVT3_SYNKA|nr:hypothetical protein SKAU_G00081680 [Synaphobranchus kaupii]